MSDLSEKTAELISRYSPGNAGNKRKRNFIDEIKFDDFTNELKSNVRSVVNESNAEILQLKQESSLLSYNFDSISSTSFRARYNLLSYSLSMNLNLCILHTLLK